MTNEFGLDYHYFSAKLKIILSGIDRYKPEEMARALTRLAMTACATAVEDVMLEEPK